MPPRTSKRKASSLNPSEIRPASKKAVPKEVERIHHLFDSYANSSIGMIDPEGIESLCSDVEVEHTDIRILMLAWKMKAERQGYFTKDEWLRGFRALRVDNLKKLKKALPDLEKEVHTPPNFEDFYSFAFRYCLTEERQKTVDIESVCVLLELILGPHFRCQVDLLVEYLKIQKDYRMINMDQWTHFHRFCHEISFPDLKNYDDTQAWPLILDNFVEWMREKLR